MKKYGFYAVLICFIALGLVLASCEENKGPNDTSHVYIYESTVNFTGSTEKEITITRTITNNLSISGGGYITLSIKESFDSYRWFVGMKNVGNGNNVTLQASDSAFVTGQNWITVIVYNGTGTDAIPMSGEFIILVNE